VGGEEIVKEKEAITAFYQRAVEVVDRLELDSPIRGSHGQSAAMAFTIYMEQEETLARTRAIDVMTFDDVGKIIDMKAYHGPGDVSEG
jgi:steroid delta-isomerase